MMNENSIKLEKTKSPVATKAVAPVAQPQRPVVIAGIGASAGGLGALEQFLRNVPVDSGIAFVIVQHLDPTHKGLMPELLQRMTSMPVYLVEDQMKVEPNCVYEIPPNKDMSILKGILHLFEPAEPRDLRPPINFFFRALADDQHERSIGIILSGMGSDGTLGVRAIKDKAGLVVVQDPESAQFDSMPRSVIDACLADIVDTVENLPAKIISYLQHVPFASGSTARLEGKQKSALEKVIILLRETTGHDFSLYKLNTLRRRIERRMGIHQIERITTYVRYLQQNPQEVELLFKEQLIGVTQFFRDPDEWVLLAQEVLPRLLAAHPHGGIIRGWVAGCSTGEEAYSLAIIFDEVVKKLKPRGCYVLQLFATDLDKDAIDRARVGLYPESICADVSAGRLQRYFVKDENGYRIGHHIRKMITFAPQNLIMDPPFTKLDLLSCRNLLIYLTPELQKKLIPLFHYSLSPGGTLFLGSAETVSTFGDLFKSCQAKSRLFIRRNSVLRPAPVDFPTIFTSPFPDQPKELSMAKTVPNLQSLADALLLKDFSPAAVLANPQGDILYINGRTGKYLEPAAGRANWNIFAMTREGLSFELASAFQKAVRENTSTTVKGCEVGTNGSAQLVDLTIQPLTKPEELCGMVMVVFTDVATPAPIKSSGRTKPSVATAAKIAEMEQQLNRNRIELQVLREGIQSSQEELKSTNEELQATNEELQSINEELTTSKEELQSMNEELHTVNAEQTTKMDDLFRVNNDMKNLLNSTETITIFLDNDLQVQRFITGTNKIFKLIPGDIGRPITDLSCALVYPDLAADTLEVLRLLTTKEKQVATNDERWYSVRIMPYRTVDNIIDGVVLTFTNITELKQKEKQLNETGAMLQTLVESVPFIIIAVSDDGTILEFNHEAELLLSWQRKDVVGRSYFELFAPNLTTSEIAETIKKMLMEQPLQTYATTITTSKGDSLAMEWSGRQMCDSDGKTVGIVAIGQKTV